MAKIIEFLRPTQVPDYTGKLLTLNPEKSRKFQCGGFMLGPRRPYAVVPAEAQMAQIHRAFQEGFLLEVNDTQDIQTEFTTLTRVSENETEKRAYVVAWKLIKDLQLACLADITDEEGLDREILCIMTSDPEEQRRIEERINEQPRVRLAPGMDNPEKYLLKLDPQ